MSISFKNHYVLPDYLSDGINSDLISVQDQSYFGNSLLSILGSFWELQYKDTDTLHSLSGSVTPLLGEQYFSILHQVLSSSIVDTPVNYTKQFELFAFNSDDAEYVYSDTDPTELLYIEFQYSGLQGVQFLSSGLFNSPVILDACNYFEVVDGVLRLYLDIFEDTIVRDNAYAYETQQLPDKTIIVVFLWASSVTVTETYLYDRYGRYLYTPENNSDSYLAVLTALQYFFTNTKTVKNIENVLNILFKLPFCRNGGETVVTIDTLNANGKVVEGAIDYDANAAADTQADIHGIGWYYRITTDRNIYFAPLYAELLVSVGDQLAPYQLISRLNRAYDYISSPDWYADVRFPFELVHSLDDYSVIETPDEFEAYRPQFFRGTAYYDGAYYHTGVFAEYNGINPFLGTRSKIDGTEFEQHLYGLMDAVLKYNLLYLYTELNYENVDYYTHNKIAEAYDALIKGVPTYLYPVIETVFKSRLVDKFDDLEDIFDPAVTIELDSDLVMVCSQRSYNGDVEYSNPLYYTYSGAFSYAADAPRFYPFGGPEGFFHDCETELGQSNVSDRYEESISVLGLREGDPTFPRKQYYHTYSGVQAYGGAVGFTLQTEGFEESSIGIELPAEDTVETPEEVTQSVIEFAADFDSAGCYGGDVPFNNARPVLYGADFTEYNKYSGESTYGGGAGFGSFVDLALAIRFDGSRDYTGFTDIQLTYGNNLPHTLQPRDMLAMSVGQTPFTSSWEMEVSDEAGYSTGSEFEDLIPGVTEQGPSFGNSVSLTDSIGGHHGEVSFNNATPMAYGSDFSFYNTHDGAFTHGGAAAFTWVVDTTLAVQFNNTRVYSGFKDYQMTYGGDFPGIINMQDTLEVNLTYAS
jgi:hypothetical protein